MAYDKNNLQFWLQPGRSGKTILEETLLDMMWPDPRMPTNCWGIADDPPIPPHIIAAIPMAVWMKEYRGSPLIIQSLEKIFPTYSKETVQAVIAKLPDHVWTKRIPRKGSQEGFYAMHTLLAFTNAFEAANSLGKTRPLLENMSIEQLTAKGYNPYDRETSVFTIVCDRDIGLLSEEKLRKIPVSAWEAPSIYGGRTHLGIVIEQNNLHKLPEDMIAQFPIDLIYQSLHWICRPTNGMFANNPEKFQQSFVTLLNNPRWLKEPKALSQIWNVIFHDHIREVPAIRKAYNRQRARIIAYRAARNRRIIKL